MTAKITFHFGRPKCAALFDFRTWLRFRQIRDFYPGKGAPARDVEIETLLPETDGNLPWFEHYGLQRVVEVAAALDPTKTTMIFTNTRGQENDPHLQMSSSLLFDVFRNYDPGHPLLAEAYREVNRTQLKLPQLRTLIGRSARLHSPSPEITTERSLENSPSEWSRIDVVDELIRGPFHFVHASPENSAPQNPEIFL